MWDVNRSRYLDFYGLASTSVTHSFEVELRTTNSTSTVSQFYIDATHMTDVCVMEGKIWY